MKTNLLKCECKEVDCGDVAIIIPASVLNVLGWKPTDEVVVDAPMTGGPRLIVYKPGQPTTSLLRACE